MVEIGKSQWNVSIEEKQEIFGAVKWKRTRDCRKRKLARLDQLGGHKIFTGLGNFLDKSKVLSFLLGVDELFHPPLAL